MAIKKEKNKHLTDDLRLELESALRKRKSFSQIKRELGIPRSTVKREIMNHRVESTKTFYGRRFNPCAHRLECQATGMCGKPDCARLCACCGRRCDAGSCPRFAEMPCPRLAAAPYVCNGCPDETKCTLRKFYYLHRLAHGEYRATLVGARQGVNLTEGELRAINEVAVPAMNKGQSPHHAMAVRYKKRRGKPVEHKVDRHCMEGRGREDCLAFIADNPALQIPQVDTVEGGRGDKCVLPTIMFPKLDFMIARIMQGKSGAARRRLLRLDWGDPVNPSDGFKGGHGISHIAAKHPEALGLLPEIIARGEVYKHEQPGRLYLLHGDAYAVLGSMHGGAKKTITEFVSSHDKAKLDFIRRRPRANSPGVDKGG